MAAVRPFFRWPFFSGACVTAPPAKPVGGGRPVTPSPVVKPALIAPLEGALANMPIYLAARPSLNDYQFLADGGETFGFSVGYSRSWIVRFQARSCGSVGSRLCGGQIGRDENRTETRSAGLGSAGGAGRNLCGGGAGPPRCPQSRRFFLTRAEEIPLASDRRQPLEGVGEARWFWTEIPLTVLSSTTQNLVALFSPSQTLKGEDRSPILSGARMEGSPTAWWRDKAEGEPPHNSGEAFQFPAVSYTPGGGH